MSAVTVDSLKMTREALCLAEHALIGHGAGPRSEQDARAAASVAAMLRDIDRRRPLRPDGRHADLHTLRCGCPWRERVRARVRRWSR